MKPLKTRTDKIEFLKRLEKGKAKIKDLIKKEYEGWICINGVYTCNQKNIAFNSDQEFLDYKKNSNAEINLLRIFPASEGAPLFENEKLVTLKID